MHNMKHREHIGTLISQQKSNSKNYSQLWGNFQLYFLKKKKKLVRITNLLLEMYILTMNVSVFFVMFLRLKKNAYLQILL